MKNCESFVSLPELAIASWPVPVKASCWLNSSGNGVAKTLPVPSPLSEPPWTM